MQIFQGILKSFMLVLTFDNKSCTSHLKTFKFRGEERSSKQNMPEFCELHFCHAKMNHYLKFVWDG